MPQNGSKIGQTAPRTGTGCPHEGPSVGPVREENANRDPSLHSERTQALLRMPTTGSWCVCETVPTLVYLTCPTLGSPFRHSLRAICTVLLDPRDPFLQSERMQGFAADPVYVKGEVFAYVGRIHNLEDLKEGRSVCQCWAKSKPKGPKDLLVPGNGNRTSAGQAHRQQAFPVTVTGNRLRSR